MKLIQFSIFGGWFPIPFCFLPVRCHLPSMPRRPTASASDARARQRVSLDVWLHARVASSLLVLQTESVAFVSDHRDDAADGAAREESARRLRDRRRTERV